MSLAESARNWVLKNLPYDEADPKIVAALQAMSPWHLLVLYLNWRDRLIPASQRRVLRSSDFNQNAIVRERGSAISQIIDDVEQGRDLTKYLSRRVKIGFELPPRPGTKKDAVLISYFIGMKRLDGDSYSFGYEIKRSGNEIQLVVPKYSSADDSLINALEGGRDSFLLKIDAFYKEICIDPDTYAELC
jgi:hypothetical protein